MKKTIAVIFAFSLLVCLDANVGRGMELSLVGLWPYGPAEAVCGDPTRKLLFMGSGGGIYIIDVSEPSNPRKISQLAVGFKITQILHHDHFLFVADPDSGIHIISISDSSRPSIVASFPYFVTDMFLHYPYLYAHSSNKLLILDIREMPDIREVGHYGPRLSNFERLSFNFPYAYLLSQRWGNCFVEVVDVSNPSTPSLVSSFVAFENYNKCIAVSGNRLFITGKSEDQDLLRIFDVSVISEPQKIGEHALPPGADIHGMAVSDNLVFLVGVDGRFRIIDTRDPAHCRELGFCPIPTRSSGSIYYGIHLSESRAYIASQIDGLQVIDVSNSKAPIKIGSVRTPNLTMGLFVSNSKVFMVDFCYGGLWIVDVSDLSNPKEVSYHHFGVCMVDVHVLGEHAYVLRWGGLAVLDVSDPFQPRELGSATVPLSTALAIRYPYAFITHKSGLTVVDISDPRSPSVLSTWKGPFSDWNHAAWHVSVFGSLAYIACGGAGVRIIDVGDPANLKEIGSFDSAPGEAFGVHIEGDTLYVANGHQGLMILDVKDPTNPVEVGSCNVGLGGFRAVKGGEPYVYVAGG